MRLFNRIFMILLLAGLFVLGLYTVAYSLSLFGYSLDNLPRTLGLSGFYLGLEGFARGVESGSLSILSVFILVAIAVLGLVLLIAELKPQAPRRVRMRSGTYITRRAVADEVVAAAGQTPGRLGRGCDERFQPPHHDHHSPVAHSGACAAPARELRRALCRGDQRLH